MRQAREAGRSGFSNKLTHRFCGERPQCRPFCHSGNSFPPHVVKFPKMRKILSEIYSIYSQQMASLNMRRMAVLFLAVIPGDEQVLWRRPTHHEIGCPLFAAWSSAGL
jgi:hypothetical protein